MVSPFTVREFLSLEIGHLLVPSRAGDQYLVSFPRSGNTWVRTMLGYLINPDAEGNPDFTRGRIPGISISRSRTIRNLESPRLIKSHTWYRPAITRAVYIVRDGRDVLISLYHYYVTREQKQLSFEDFFQAYLDRKFGQLWHENVESWLIRGKQELGSDLLVMQFEQLKSDSKRALQDIATFLSIPVDNQRLAEAIRISDINRMREIEIQRRGPIADQNASFYRSGRSGEWKEYFSPAISQRFEDSAGKAMILAGYA